MCWVLFGFVGVFNFSDVFVLKLCGGCYLGFAVFISQMCLSCDCVVGVIWVCCCAHFSVG